MNEFSSLTSKVVQIDSDSSLMKKYRHSKFMTCSFFIHRNILEISSFVSFANLSIVNLLLRLPCVSKMDLEKWTCPGVMRERFNRLAAMRTASFFAKERIVASEGVMTDSNALFRLDKWTHSAVAWSGGFLKPGYTLMSEIIKALQNRRRVSLVARDTTYSNCMFAQTHRDTWACWHFRHSARKSVKISSFVVIYANTV